MSEQNPLFRKAALDKLSSPERLDVLMQVTSPKGWLALATMGCLLAGLLVWSVVGSIPTRLQGQGMLIRGGALREIRATGPGVLEELNLTQGASVSPGDLVGQIRRPDIVAGTAEAEQNYNRLLGEARATEAELRATQIGLRAQVSSANEEMARTEGQLAKAEEEINLRREQLAKGLATRMQVAAAEREAEGIRARIASLRGQARNYSAQVSSVEQQIRAAYLRADNARGQLEQGKVQEEMVSRIESEVAGRIIEVRVRRGDTVQAGQTLAIVEPEDAAMQSVVYFDARTAKQIRPGMEAQISPTDIKREEYGFIKGTVQFVGEGPVSIEKVRQDLANQALAQEIYGQTAKIEIRAKLNENANTPSGLEWSSSIGPAFQINSNTRINVEVVVDRRPPYTYVLPIIRGAVGVS